MIDFQRASENPQQVVSASIAAKIAANVAANPLGQAPGQDRRVGWYCHRGDTFMPFTSHIHTHRKRSYRPKIISFGKKLDKR